VTDPVLVLLHAFPLTSEIYAQQRDRLSEGTLLLTPDFRGFGQRPPGEDPPSLDVLADDVARQLDEHGVDRAVVGGTSMGGYVAIAFARRHPQRLAGLLLANTKADADSPEAAANRRRIAVRVEHERSVEVLHDEVEPKLLGTTTRSDRPDIVAQVHALVAAATPASVAWAQRAMAERPDSYASLAACQAPALVIVGDEDELMPPDAGPAMVDALPAAELVRLPKAGHLACLESPAAWADAARSLLTRSN
jgi:pimeloyl-ACP methyl ester carboxylesterase